MVSAIIDHCLPKVTRGVALPTQGLARRPDSDVNWRAYSTADGSVTIFDTDTDFACQVVARADPEPISEVLKDWSDAGDYVLVGQVPLTTGNRRGLYLYGRAEAGGYVQIHVTNLPDGYVAALLVRSDSNRDAERALSQ